MVIRCLENHSSPQFYPPNFSPSFLPSFLKLQPVALLSLISF
ncbi:hypothetical protein ES332_A06G140900v1 [Gossypium tomentosum]|uniref:Uncharacterized protein n=1 Tax=Gossypium tomentosum TaxID=34277 RepID=A0A5D2Q4R5_GOSTO|nr:hypothetical protein ES332_A06G140900v1 [Gossypium tomentosum]